MLERLNSNIVVYVTHKCKQWKTCLLSYHSDSTSLGGMRLCVQNIVMPGMLPFAGKTIM